MSRTYYKKTNIQIKSKKKPKNKKFFGYTDGLHSKSNEILPIKRVHYIKYGWKNSKNLQHRSILKYKLNKPLD